MKKSIMVLLKEPRKPAKLRKIKNDLPEMQRIVGGYIEAVPIYDGGILVCNEEGIINDLRFNCVVDRHQVFGTFFVCGQDGEDFDDVPLGVCERFQV